MSALKGLLIGNGRPLVRRLTFLLLAGSSLALPSTAWAQEATAPPETGASQPAETAAQGDIIVTASRREESLSKVPISVTAFTPEIIEQRGIRNTDDIARLTPGVTLVQNAPVRGFNIAIRGIDSRVGAGTVGIYIDDTPIQVRRLGNFATTIYPQIFDLERVEVLRGPQGTLFGAGSMGGTVRFITPQPSLNELDVFARGELATTEKGSETYEGGLALGVPIVADRLALRASAVYRRDGGWVDRVDPDTLQRLEKDTNRIETFATRGTLTWAATDTLTVTPAMFYQRRKINNSNQFWNNRSFLPGVNGVPQPASTFTVPFSDPAKGDFVRGDPQAQPGTERVILPSLKVEAELGGVAAIANLAYLDSKADFRFDFSTPDVAVISGGALSRIPGYTGFNDQRDAQRNYTAELRIQPVTPNDRFNYVLGVFYAYQRQTAFGGISGANLDSLFRSLTGNPNVTATAILGAPFVEPGTYALVNDDRAIDEQFAGFGEISWNITPELRITGGVRVSRTTLDYSSIGEGPFNGPRSVTDVETDSTPITPKVNISYQADRNNLFYATAAKGFRVGGGNKAVPGFLCGPTLTALGLPGTPNSYEPDSLWSYEVGSKNQLIGRRLQVDVSAYQIDWKNLQQQVFLPCQFFYVTNAGKARSRGVDLALTLRPADTLSFSAAVAYNDAKYTETVFPGTIPGTGPGSRIVSRGDVIDNPPWTVVVSARYDIPIGDNEAYLTGDFTHRSRNKGRSPVQNPLSIAFEGYPTLEAVNLLNLRAGYKFGNVDASLFVNNLTNDFPIVYFRQDSPGTLLRQNASVRPRTFGLTISYRR